MPLPLTLEIQERVFNLLRSGKLLGIIKCVLTLQRRLRIIGNRIFCEQNGFHRYSSR